MKHSEYYCNPYISFLPPKISPIKRAWNFPNEWRQRGRSRFCIFKWILAVSCSANPVLPSPQLERCAGRCSEHVFFKAPLEKRLWWIFKKEVCSGNVFFFHKSTLMEQSRKAVSSLGMLLILLLFSSKLTTFKISIHWRRQVGIFATTEFSRAVLRTLWKWADNRTTKIQKQPLGHSSWNKPACSQHHLSPEAQGRALTPWLSYRLASPRGESRRNLAKVPSACHLHLPCSPVSVSVKRTSEY